MIYARANEIFTPEEFTMGGVRAIHSKLNDIQPALFIKWAIG